MSFQRFFELFIQRDDPLCGIRLSFRENRLITFRVCCAATNGDRLID